MMHRMTSHLTIAAWAALELAGLGVSRPISIYAQVSPEKSAGLIKPAQGLEATLWASEPLLVNPTNIDVDSRGRVWVAEGLNYRLTRGGNKRFHRIEEADRIKILEDTDGDGKADKVTVFADRIFPVPMGIAVEEHHDKAGKYTGCRVFVGNSPDLLVLEDTDGDDKADKRYPLLTGFGGIDSDHGVHGMVLGLDGKLYFTHGDGCCSVQQDHSERAQNFNVVDKSGRHVSSDQLAHTLRANRDGTQFEIICDRQRNNYETSLELVRQHLHQRQRRRRQPRLPGDLGDGRRSLRLSHAGKSAALGRGGARKCPQARRHRQRQSVQHHGLRGRALTARVPGRHPRDRRRHSPGQFLSLDPQRGRVPDRGQGLSHQRRLVVPSGRRLRRP